MQHRITIVAQEGLPGASDDTASVSGAVLTHNGVAYDLSAIPDGGDGIPEGTHPFVGSITRTGNMLTYDLRMVLSAETMAEWASLMNAVVTIEDAPVPGPEGWA